ncbi:quinone-dependent dihydroorotate dehydrogenase [Polyangium sp. 6x1]|uniref:quinone-dependent dihydroorotate dehydrogenase n=1 Tax=Polyangium sp. 6x1 TaxID=3042689 RepID=UPI002482E643|nr:quinone-dependent dihydroorotate dehydrogenase [Polyangium sp. 6x1]MDI1444127.1 quinone-dependent dihydroorotate dehydrogenase [Polyangium sp. 6x1]
MYRLLFSLLLRRLSAETAHHLGFGLLRFLMALPGARALSKRLFGPRDPRLAVRAFGLDFPGPLGLAAGFDKDARGFEALGALGFAFVEIGTVTGEPQGGNPKPRLFRLPADRALVNRMGFNNEGSRAAAERLARRQPGGVIVGANIGKTKVVPESEAAADYVASAERLAAHADYLVVNVSSPNTPGLRDLQSTEKLRPLLAEVRAALDRASPGRRVPLLVKIAPDLADEDIDAIGDLARELGLDGIIATNTTIRRDGLATDAAEVAQIGAGGLSGKPVKARALAVLRRLRARVGDSMVLVAAGGVESADDAWERIAAGATLVQAYTAFIYEGPAFARRIHEGILSRMRAEGIGSIAELVGKEAR